MNFMEMMKKAQTLQNDVQRMKSEFDQQSFQGESGGGAVSISMSGNGKIQKVVIASSLLRPDQAEIVQDLIMSAVNHATEERRAKRAEKMQSLTAGLPVPPGLMKQL